MLSNPVIPNFATILDSTFDNAFGAPVRPAVVLLDQEYGIVGIGFCVHNFHDEEARQYTFHLFGEDGDEDYEGEIPTLP